MVLFAALAIFVGHWLVIGIATISIALAGAYFAWPGNRARRFDPIDIFWVIALLYVVVGSVAGSVLAVHQDKSICWPTAVFSSLWVECADHASEQFWMYAAVLPVELLNGAVRGLLVFTSSYEADSSIVMIATRMLVLGVIVACGLPVIYERARTLAWLVLAVLIGEIIYLRTLVPDVANWLWAN